MKILYIMHSALMDGSTLSLLNLIKGIKDAGNTPIIVCPPEMDEQFLKEVKKENYIVHAVSLFPIITNLCTKSLPYYKSKRKQMLRSMKELLKVILKVKPDIIHTNTGVEHEGFWCSKLLGIPHVWHLREYQDKDINCKVMPSKGIFCKMLRHSWSISITHDIQNHFGLSNYKKACTIYNGVLNEEQTFFNPNKERYFISACRVVKEKCIEDTIIAFSEFTKTIKGYKLLILGFGNKEYINNLKVLCKNLHCDDSVEFIGYKPLNVVTEYMRKANALIVSSKHEGFGRMTAEAILSGCMVIGRNTGGTKEIISQTGGYMFSTKDELLNCMYDIVNMNSDEYRTIIFNAQEKARRLFTCEQNVKNTLAFYDKIQTNNSACNLFKHLDK